MAKTDETKTEKVDFIAQIGRNFGVKKAKDLFGDKWQQALDAVAKAGSYGEFTSKHYDDPFFGGFAIPDPATVEGETSEDEKRRAHYNAVRAKINTVLNNVK